ncbi:hypothetical protein DNTS_002638 [Danionella cerebrum]|uniref:WxxW domain-containing protein n=1 Tax=Danionella cerebrum TaxID=2873325 RepID=A0A553QKH5_9TELE|nr:hypothetical protein DNTS_002638 [Danionella translucida]
MKEIQCRAKSYPEVPITQLGQVLECNTKDGLVCLNKNQGLAQQCHQYEIRVFCCDEHCGFETPLPTSTTIQLPSVTMPKIHTSITVSNLKEIECRAKSYPEVPITQLGQVLECNTKDGLVCLNKNQGLAQQCHQYEIRVFCCDEHCGIETPLPTSTTIQLPSVTMPKIHTSITVSNLKEIKCRAKSYPDVPITQLGQVLQCNTKDGLVCLNKNQGLAQQCHQYEIRVFCCDEHCGTKATIVSTDRSSQDVTTANQNVSTGQGKSTTSTSTTKLSLPFPSSTKRSTDKATTAQSGWGDNKINNIKIKFYYITSRKQINIFRINFRNFITNILKIIYKQFTEDLKEIQCRAKSYPDVPITQLGQVLQCDTKDGLVCLNKNQGLAQQCHQYEIRVFCCDEHCGTKATSMHIPQTTKKSMVLPSTISSTSLNQSSTNWGNNNINNFKIKFYYITSRKQINIFRINFRNFITNILKIIYKQFTEEWHAFREPISGPDGGQLVSFETISDFYGNFCSDLKEIQCRAKSYPEVPITQLGQVLQCNTKDGLVCLNKNQGLAQQCHQYEIRVFCCDEHCGIETPLPTSTTIQLPSVTMPKIHTSITVSSVSSETKSINSPTTTTVPEGMSTTPIMPLESKISTTSERLSTTPMMSSTQTTLKMDTVTTNPGCNCYWSDWNDFGGRTEGHEGDLKEIKCRAKSYPDVPITQLGQVLQCNTKDGLVCLNKNQGLAQQCHQYEIRVFCCDEHCGTKATIVSTDRSSQDVTTANQNISTVVSTDRSSQDVTTANQNVSTVVSTDRSSQDVTTANQNISTGQGNSTTSTSTTKLSLPFPSSTKRSTDKATTAQSGQNNCTAKYHIDKSKYPTKQFTTFHYIKHLQPIVWRNDTQDISKIIYWHNCTNVLNYSVSTDRSSQDVTTANQNISTEFLDFGGPTVGPQGGQIIPIQKITQLYPSICSAPKKIECRSKHYPQLLSSQLGQVITCNEVDGLLCMNKNQDILKQCFDYDIRVLCCNGKCDNSTQAQVTIPVPSFSTPEITISKTPSATAIPAKTSNPTLSCFCQWSDPIDFGGPTVGAKGGQIIPIKKISETFPTICSAPQKVECRSKSYPQLSLSQLGQNIVCNEKDGLLCLNKNQDTNQQCFYYNIRVFCCHGRCDNSTQTPTPSPNLTAAIKATASSNTLSAASESSSTATTSSCFCNWSKWLAFGGPTTGPKGGKIIPIQIIFDTLKTTCLKPQNIECRAKHYPELQLSHLGQSVKCNLEDGLFCLNKNQNISQQCFDYELGQTVKCNLKDGLVCLNKNQNVTQQCFNYEIRLLCCNEVCGSATPPLTLGQTIKCNLKDGLVCLNKNQNVTQQCFEYEMRLLCCNEVCGSATPPLTVNMDLNISTTNLPLKINATTTVSKTLEAKCICKWSDWRNFGKPTTGAEGGQLIPLKIDTSCSKQQKIQCRAKMYPGLPLSKLGQTIKCNLKDGLVCLNKNQNVTQQCFEYEMRLLCCTVDCTSQTLPAAEWTNWFRFGSPTKGPEGGKLIPIKFIIDKTPCSKPQDVQCRARLYPGLHLFQLGQTVKCNLKEGLVCLNKNQHITQQCFDYEMRLLCCNEVCDITTLPSAKNLALNNYIPNPTPIAITPLRDIRSPCDCQWSAWMDLGAPTTGPEGGEIIPIQKLRNVYSDICLVPSKAECRAKLYPGLSLSELGQEVRCNSEEGLACYNRKQAVNQQCFDYEIKLLCCHGLCKNSSQILPKRLNLIHSSLDSGLPVNYGSSMVKKHDCICEVNGSIFNPGYKETTMNKEQKYQKFLNHTSIWPRRTTDCC